MSQSFRRSGPALEAGGVRRPGAGTRTSLERSLTGLFDRLFTPLNPLRSASERHWHPFTDIYEAGTHLLVRMEVAGIDQESLELTWDGSCLIVRGVRQDPLSDRGYGCQQLEISYGPFERVICLPEGYWGTELRADYGRSPGFLEITIAKERA